MNRFALGAVAAVSLAATLAGCSSSTPAPAASTPPAATTPAAAPTSAPVAPSAPASAPTSAPASAPASAPIAINKEIDDPVLGVKVTIIQAVRGFKPLDSKYSDSELIVVQVKMDASQAKYAVTFGDGSFSYSTSANKFGGMNATTFSGVPEWMKTNGYQPLTAAKRGETQTGWVAASVSYTHLTLPTSDLV